MVDVQEFLIFMASRTLYKDEDQNIRCTFTSTFTLKLNFFCIYFIELEALILKIEA